MVGASDAWSSSLAFILILSFFMFFVFFVFERVDAWKWGEGSTVLCSEGACA